MNSLGTAHIQGGKLMYLTAHFTWAAYVEINQNLKVEITNVITHRQCHQCNRSIPIEAVDINIEIRKNTICFTSQHSVDIIF
jgi:hypothetical protein